MKRIFDSEVAYCAEKIKNEVYQPTNTDKTTIFLCGGERNNPKYSRSKLADLLTRKKSAYQYNIIYPEDMFEELMFGIKDMDLLSLENMLAESVDALIIIPESPGSFAELGAFTNNEALRKKIICVQNKTYKKKKSFINYGPIRLIKNSKLGKVILIDLDNLEEEFKKIKKAINLIKKNVYKKNENTISLLQLENFLLASIYLLEPIHFQFLKRLVEYVINDVQNAIKKTKIGLNILTKDEYIYITQGSYKLTRNGFQHFRDLLETGTLNSSIKFYILDKMRLDVMSWRYRNKKLYEINRVSSS